MPLVTVTGWGGRSKIWRATDGYRGFVLQKNVTLWRISMISPQIQMRRDWWMPLFEILRRTLQQLKGTVCDFTSRPMWLRKPIYLSKADAYTQRGMEYTTFFHLSWICLHHHLGDFFSAQVQWMPGTFLGAPKIAQDEWNSLRWW